MGILQQIAAAFLPPSTPAAADSEDTVTMLPYYRTRVDRVDGTIGARRSTPRELATTGFVDISQSNNTANASGVPRWAAGVVGPSVSQFTGGSNSFFQQIAQFLGAPGQVFPVATAGGQSTTPVFTNPVPQPVYNPVSPPPPPPPVTTQPAPVSPLPPPTPIVQNPVYVPPQISNNGFRSNGGIQVAIP